MPDLGIKMTDDRIKGLMKRLEGVYSEAYKKAIENEKTAIAKYASLTDEALKDLTPEARQLKREAFRREVQRTHDLADKIGAELANAGETAAKITQGEMTNIYGLNYDFTAYNINRQTGLSLDWTIYDRNQLAVMMQKEQPPFTKIAYRNLGKDKVIVQRLQNELIQATLNGESQQKIIRRIKGVTGQSTRQAKRVAQTERVRVQSQGRNMAIDEASEMGIEMQKMWVSRMDARVRDDHAAVTGEIVDSGEKFSNGLLFPGDPNGEAEQVISCRCYEKPMVKNVSPALARHRAAFSKAIGFDEWRASRK